MSQISKQQKPEGIVKYHELKRPLTKEEKRKIRENPDIEDVKLMDKLAVSSLALMIAGTSLFAVGLFGIEFARVTTTTAGVFMGSVLGVVGCSGALGILGKCGYDAYRYFSDRHRRIRALEQEKIKENTQRDSQELQRAREAKIAEAQKIQEEFYERQTPVVEKRKLLNKKKADKPRQGLVALLDSLNKQPANSERKAAKEAAVKTYRQKHPKGERE